MVDFRFAKLHTIYLGFFGELFVFFSQLQDFLHVNGGFSPTWPCNWEHPGAVDFTGELYYPDCISRTITIQLGFPITNQGLGRFPTGLRFRRRRREFTNITRDPIDTNATSSIRERSNRVIDLDKL